MDIEHHKANLRGSNQAIGEALSAVPVLNAALAATYVDLIFMSPQMVNPN